MNELDRWYKYKFQVSYVDRDLFRDTVEQHKTEPLSRIESWIKVFSPVIRLSKKQQNKLITADIRKFMTWKRNGG